MKSEWVYNIYIYYIIYVYIILYIYIILYTSYYIYIYMYHIIYIILYIYIYICIIVIYILLYIYIYTVYMLYHIYIYIFVGSWRIIISHWKWSFRQSKARACHEACSFLISWGTAQNSWGRTNSISQWLLELTYRLPCRFPPFSSPCWDMLGTSSASADVWASRSSGKALTSFHNRHFCSTKHVPVSALLVQPHRPGPSKKCFRVLQ